MTMRKSDFYQNNELRRDKTPSELSDYALCNAEALELCGNNRLFVEIFETWHFDFLDGFCSDALIKAYKARGALRAKKLVKYAQKARVVISLRGSGHSRKDTIKLAPCTVGQHDYMVYHGAKNA